MAIVGKRSVLSSSFLNGAGKTSFILNLEVSFLVVIKERRNFYIAFFVVDVPVVPAGAIVLKYSITSILF